MGEKERDRDRDRDRVMPTSAVAHPWTNSSRSSAGLGERVVGRLLASGLR